MTIDGGRYFKRNFTLGVVTGAFVNVGLAFFDPATVLPVFVAALGGSATLIGFVSALHGVGWFLPQVFASRLAVTRRYLIHMYRTVALVRIGAFAGVVLTVFAVSPDNRLIFLSLFVGLLLVAHLAGGVSAIPFLEITSKTIPVTRRGKFFGMRRLIGGSLGIVAGVLVAIILDDQAQHAWIGARWLDAIERLARGVGLTGHTFPIDFAMVFLLGTIFMALGMITFSFAGETPAPAVKRSARFVALVESGVALLRADADYRRFYLVRICWQFTAMAFPFYVSFAYDELGVPVSTVGLFLAIWVGSGVFSNFLWGRMMDDVGNKSVLVVTAVLSILPPLIVLFVQGASPVGVTAGTGVLLAVCSTFFINGVARSGRVIAHITYLLEYAPESERPLYVGFMNSATFPFMLTPLLAGVIIEVFDMRTLFVVCLVFATINTALSVSLREPRSS